MTKESGQAANPSPPASGKVELKGLFSQLLGVWYPKHYVLAAINPTDGTAAVEELLSAGFGSNSVHLEDAARVCGIRAAIYEQRTPLERAAASFSRALTDEGLFIQEYFEEADAGASLIAVLAPEPQLVTEAARILASHGARRMKFYGDRTIADLPSRE
jgi:hypothetical protein